MKKNLFIYSILTTFFLPIGYLVLILKNTIKHPILTFCNFLVIPFFSALFGIYTIYICPFFFLEFEKILMGLIVSYICNFVFNYLYVKHILSKEESTLANSYSLVTSILCLLVLIPLVLAILATPTWLKFLIYS
jgi:hypothetical protein